jgi:hypothetical protein
MFREIEFIEADEEDGGGDQGPVGCIGLTRRLP